jgi:hypothetical protein
LELVSLVLAVECRGRSGGSERHDLTARGEDVKAEQLKSQRVRLVKQVRPCRQPALELALCTSTWIAAGTVQVPGL